MPPPRKYKYKGVKEYSEEFGVSGKTIATWKDEEAPLDDHDLMAKWFAGRAKCGRPVKLWLKQYKDKCTAETKKLRRQAAPAGKGKVPEESELIIAQRDRLKNLGMGAASALKNLEQEERDSYRAMIEARIEERDSVTQDSLHALWLKNSAELRQYDKSVANDQRESGQLIPKDDVVRYLQNVGYFIRVASRMTARMFASDLYQRSRPEICEYITLQLWSVFQSSVTSLPGDSSGNSVPNWVITALLENLSHSMNDVAESSKIRIEVMAKLHILLDAGVDLNEALKEEGAVTPSEYRPAGEPEYFI